MSLKIGIIGGTGLDNPDLFTDVTEVEVKTEFGCPSDKLREGKINEVPCVLLARHGRQDRIMPTNINYRANLLALKKVGCTHVIASTACGSLREEIRPGDFVIIDQFIDRTTKRNPTFYDSSSEHFKGVLHLPMDEPFCEKTRNILYKCCSELKFPTHRHGTNVTVEGPRFSSKAESKMFRMLGADTINMTTVPEVCLAKELGLCYAAIAMATDYDCWREGEPVSVEMVMKTMKTNSDHAVQVIKKAVSEIAKEDWTQLLSQKEAEVKGNTLF